MNVTTASTFQANYRIFWFPHPTFPKRLTPQISIFMICCSLLFAWYIFWGIFATCKFCLVVGRFQFTILQKEKSAILGIRELLSNYAVFLEHIKGLVQLKLDTSWLKTFIGFTVTQVNRLSLLTCLRTSMRTKQKINSTAS